VTRVGPMVSSGKLDDLRLLNFGLRALSEPISAGALSNRLRATTHAMPPGFRGWYARALGAKRPLTRLFRGIEK